MEESVAEVMSVIRSLMGSEIARKHSNASKAGSASLTGSDHQTRATEDVSLGQGEESVYIQCLQQAVGSAEEATLERLRSSTLLPIGTGEGQLGTICREWTQMLDITAKQEVTNETLSYIPMKVSAVCDEDVVLGYITMVEQQVTPGSEATDCH